MTSTGGAGRMPALDGVRGVAIGMVVVHHVGGIPWLNHPGAAGVTVFFVLSGYLITRILLRELDRAGRLDLGGFYLRRAARLLPALVCVLAATLLLAPGAVVDVVLSGTYLMDFAVAGGLAGSPLGHTWSLAVEEQFYLVWPAVLLLATWRRWNITRTVGVLLVAALAWRVAATVLLDFPRVYFSPDTNAFALLAGCLLASLERDGRLPTLSRRTGTLATLALAAPVLLPGTGAILWGVVAACALAAVMVTSARTAERGLLTNPVLRWLGRISYGLYLWHGFLFAFAPTGPSRLVMLAVSLLLSELSFRYVEQPILDWARSRPSDDPVELHHGARQEVRRH